MRRDVQEYTLYRTENDIFYLDWDIQDWKPLPEDIRARLTFMGGKAGARFRYMRKHWLGGVSSSGKCVGIPLGPVRRRGGSRRRV